MWTKTIGTVMLSTILGTRGSIAQWK
jgi:hypothetical protein